MNRVHAAFDGEIKSPALGDLCLSLLAQQKAAWPQLGQAYEALEQTKVRDLSCSGFSIRLLHNPGRLTSTTAPMGEAEIRKRPCFLCEDHLPDPQRAVLYRDHYLILSNPMPITSGHFTISHVAHRPQAISGALDTFLRLASDFGPHWTILYNGPRCGASAPDHLHFQAIPAGQTPIEREMEDKERLVPFGDSQDGLQCHRVKNVGREVLLFTAKEPVALFSAISHYLEVLRRVTQSLEEPMINLIGHYKDETYAVLLFPRRKHRPDVYFIEREHRIMVSPAVVEMAGIMVTPFLTDFERLDSRSVEAIYGEVSLPADL